MAAHLHFWRREHGARVPRGHPLVKHRDRIARRCCGFGTVRPRPRPWESAVDCPTARPSRRRETIAILGPVKPVVTDDRAVKMTTTRQATDHSFRRWSATTSRGLARNDAGKVSTSIGLVLNSTYARRR